MARYRTGVVTHPGGWAAIGRGYSTNEVVMVVAVDIPVDEWVDSIWSSSLPVILVTLILAAIVLSGLIAVKRRNRIPLDQQRQWVYLEAIFVAIFGMAPTVSISMLVMESEAGDRRSILRRVASTNSTQITTVFREVERKLSALERFYVGSDVVICHFCLATGRKFHPSILGLDSPSL